MERQWPFKTWKFFGPIMNWYYSRRLDRLSQRIATDIFPELWENSRRKITPGTKADSGLAAYAEARAAHLAQARVEAIVRIDCQMSAEVANKLIVKTSQAASRMVLSAATEALRSAA